MITFPTDQQANHDSQTFTPNSLPGPRFVHFGVFIATAAFPNIALGARS